MGRYRYQLRVVTTEGGREPRSEDWVNHSSALDLTASSYEDAMRRADELVNTMNGRTMHVKVNKVTDLDLMEVLS